MVRRVAFAFLPQYFGKVAGTYFVCGSAVRVVRVVGTLIGGGDIRTLTAIIEFISTFYAWK